MVGVRDGGSGGRARCDGGPARVVVADLPSLAQNGRRGPWAHEER